MAIKLDVFGRTPGAMSAAVMEASAILLLVTAFAAMLRLATGPLGFAMESDPSVDCTPCMPVAPDPVDDIVNAPPVFVTVVPPAPCIVIAPD